MWVKVFVLKVCLVIRLKFVDLGHFLKCYDSILYPKMLKFITLLFEILIKK